jgi:hypothetical protein
VDTLSHYSHTALTQHLCTAHCTHILQNCAHRTHSYRAYTPFTIHPFTIHPSTHPLVHPTAHPWVSSIPCTLCAVSKVPEATVVRALLRLLRLLGLCCLPKRVC